MSRHAHERLLEFGLTPDIVTEIATRPDVAHTNKAGESVRVCDRHPDWTVVVGGDGCVITVLRRTSERWEHASPALLDRPTQPRPSPPGGLAAAGSDAAPTPPGRAAPRRRRRPTPALQARAVVVTVAVEPCVLEVARRLAGEDPRRLRINPDGTVTVLNKPRGSS